MNIDKRKFLINVVCLPALQITALWAVWQWYAGRLLNSADGETWSLLALSAAIGLCVWETKSPAVNAKSLRFNLLLPTILLIIYAIAFPFVPPLVRAILAVTAISALLSNLIFKRVLHLGLSVLLLLSLPLTASLNFFAGFPLRVIVGEASAFLLRLNGLAVWREGVCLHWGESLIAIDAPCSGIKMIWFGLFLAAILTTVFRLNWQRAALTFGLSFAVILLGNIARASALFYTETGIVKTPAWTHEGVGVFAFILVAAGIAGIAGILRKDFKWSELSFS